MFKEKSLKAFECPSCGAPLEVREGTKTVTCRYCHMAVRIPQEPQPVHIDALERSLSREQSHQDVEKKNDNQTVLVLYLAGAIFVFIAWLMITNARKAPPPVQDFAPIPTITPLPPYASHLLTFDTNMDNALTFFSKDLDLDTNGNILVAVSDVDSSTLRKFDSQGAFVSNEFETNFNILSFSAGVDGILALSFGFDVHLYSKGQEIRVLQNQSPNDVVIGPDGSLYIVGFDQTISRYDRDGVLDLQIHKVFETQLGVQELTSHLAVDHLGNMYLLGESNAYLFKFAPDGALLGKYDGKDNNRPFGTFSYPKSVAVDQYGRIFVSDFEEILVFDENFMFIDTFSTIEDLGVEALAVDDEHLYVLTNENTVEIYALPLVSQ